MATDNNTKLNDSYTLGDFTKTNYQLEAPNMPSTQDQMNNLVATANLLVTLTSQVGPFTLLSGFRTAELQNALASAGEPTATGKSFHEVGRGVDITPTTMGIDEMFGKILANEELRNQFAEIAIKPAQNAIHLASNVEGDVRTPKITGLDENKNYVRLSVEQIQDYIQPWVAQASAIAEEIVSKPAIPMALVGAAAGAALLIVLSRKSAVGAR